MRTTRTGTSWTVCAAGAIVGLLGFLPGRAVFATNYEELLAEHSGKCLDVSNASTDNGGNVQQWSCAGVPQQHWVIHYVGSWNGRMWHEVRVEHSGKCLDVSGASKENGANVQQWDCVNAPQQHWTLNFVGSNLFELLNENSGKCLDVDNAWTGDGVNVKQWDCAGVPQQHWSGRIP
jgi:hypothetical protein